MLSVLTFNAGHGEYQIPTVLNSAASLLLGVVLFVRHGGALVTATGLFSLSSAMFVGVAGMYLTLTLGESTSRGLAYASALGLLAQSGVGVIAGRSVAGKGTTSTSRATANRLLGVGVFGLAVALVFRLSVPGVPEVLTEGLAFSAIVLYTIGVLWRPDSRLVSLSSASVLGMFALYAEIFHSGTGRLRVVALACSILILVSARFRWRALKPLVVALIPIAVMWLALDRLQLQESIASGNSIGRTGLESMMAPMIVFGQLIEAIDQGYPLSMGMNLLSLPALFMGDSAPPGTAALGYELVRISSPERYGSGFSVVATFAGELTYNFGYWGVVLGIVPLGFAIRWLDIKLTKTLFDRELDMFQLFSVAIWVTLVGGIADFVWSGHHTFITRFLTRLPLLAVVLLLSAFDRSLTRTRQRDLDNRYQ